MNIETREVRQEEDLSAADRESGKWVRMGKRYKDKLPLSPEDQQRILEANARLARARGSQAMHRARRAAALEEGGR